jgi:DNA mismatch repair protein MutL
MIPELISLSVDQVACLEEMQEKLSTMSFGFNKVSDTDVEVTKVPTLLSGKNMCDLFNELAENSWNESNVDSNAEIMENILATIACHSAVRSGEILTDNEMIQMLNQAGEVDFYHNCPHGRRVFRWFKKSEVARWFDRL